MSISRTPSPLRLWSPLSFLAVALAMALSATPARAQIVPVPLSVLPNPAPANKAFTLSLYGVTANCNTVFSRESVTVYGNRVDLRYTMDNRIIIDPPIFIDDPKIAQDVPVPPLCPIYADGQKPASDGSIIEPDIMANVPMFQMPAMKPGTYEVWATNMPECLYTNPACAIKVAPVSAGNLVVSETVSGLTFTITPAIAAADKGFDLQLLSYGFNCGTTYDNLDVSMDGDVINLSFKDYEHAGTVCPAIYKPYGPTFKMPALPVGSYKVMATRKCTATVCNYIPVSTLAGTLTIQGSVARKGWFLKEHAQLAGKAFTMQLLNQDVGNCTTTVSHQGVTQSGGGIYTTFLMETHPENICIQDMHPWGPSFSMQAMKVGTYPVYVTQLLACEVTAPFCAIDRIAPVPSDTLVVMTTLAVRISELRAHGPRVSLRGNIAVFALPQGRAGAWHAELVSVEGRVLGDRTVTGAAGDKVEISVSRAPANAVSLLRLTSPEGKQQFLPIVR